ncbi:MAG: hypothetical protein ABIH34_04155 [Nanoarchaeota archaeon]
MVFSKYRWLVAFGVLVVILIVVSIACAPWLFSSKPIVRLKDVPRADADDPITVGDDSILVINGTQSGIKVGIFNAGENDVVDIAPQIACPRAALDNIQVFKRTIKADTWEEFSFLFTVDGEPGKSLCAVTVPGIDALAGELKEFTLEIKEGK